MDNGIIHQMVQSVHVPSDGSSYRECYHHSRTYTSYSGCYVATPNIFQLALVVRVQLVTICKHGSTFLDKILGILSPGAVTLSPFHSQYDCCSKFCVPTRRSAMPSFFCARDHDSSRIPNKIG